MTLQLFVVAGPDKDRAFPIQIGPDLMIGRSPQAYYHVTDPSISRNHCQILREGDQVTVIDNGAEGGTLVNGQPIARQVLQPNDIVQIGQTQFRLQTDEAPAPEAAEEVETVDFEVVEEEALPDVNTLRILSGQTLAYFHVGAVIGVGDHGLVFLGTDLKNPQHVALKVLLPHFLQGSEAVQRFSGAMKTALPLRHPHLVGLLGAGKSLAYDKSGPYCWIALQHIYGYDMALRINKVQTAGKADWPGAFRVAVHVARALGHAHGLKIIHRNVTPKNIMLEAETRTVKLGDLLLSRALEETLTPPAGSQGEAAYLAPERKEGLAGVDERSDLYGLGATLYALLTGQAPAEGTPPAEVFKRLRQAEREKGSKQLAAVPRSFETVVLRLLAPAKKDRFQTARELLDELTQLGKAEGLQG